MEDARSLRLPVTLSLPCPPIGSSPSLPHRLSVLGGESCSRTRTPSRVKSAPPIFVPGWGVERLRCQGKPPPSQNPPHWLLSPLQYESKLGGLKKPPALQPSKEAW